MYASKLLHLAGMGECNPAVVPMEPRLKLSKESKAPAIDATFYRTIMGCLRYLVHTRPDISFAVGYVSRFMEAPTSEHLAAVKRLLRYIAGTINLGCKYIVDGEEKLTGYSDLDMAGDVDDRKSTSGVLFMMGNNPITWQLAKQNIVALSSCEAEYVAATTAACQGVWLQRLMQDLVERGQDTVIIHIDKKSAIKLCKNPIFHEWSKHIDVRFHFIRECIKAGKINVEHVRTGEQLADILTKPVGRVRFLELREKIGMVKVK
jgi:hypothetical protein